MSAEGAWFGESPSTMMSDGCSRASLDWQFLKRDTPGRGAGRVLMRTLRDARILSHAHERADPLGP